MNSTPNPTPTPKASLDPTNTSVSVDAGAVIALFKLQIGNMALDLAVATVRAETAERMLAAQTDE